MNPMEQAIEWARQQNLTIVEPSKGHLFSNECWAAESKDGTVELVDGTNWTMRVFYGD